MIDVEENDRFFQKWWENERNQRLWVKQLRLYSSIQTKDGLYSSIQRINVANSNSESSVAKCNGKQNNL